MYKTKSSACAQNHGDKHKINNRFCEHFWQTLNSQNTKTGVSEQNFKIFWKGEFPQTPGNLSSQ